MLRASQTTTNGPYFVSCLYRVPISRPRVFLSLLFAVLFLRYSCNGAIVSDAEGGDIVQMSGDQRTNIHEFLVDQQICVASQVGALQESWQEFIATHVFTFSSPRVRHVGKSAAWEILAVKWNVDS